MRQYLVQLPRLALLVAWDAKHRSKRELIEKFIRENLPDIEDPNDIPDDLTTFGMRKESRHLPG